MPWRYHVYGLRVVASAAVPGLAPARTRQPADVSIFLDDGWPSHLFTPDQQVTYESSAQDSLNRPLLRVERLLPGAETLLAYPDGTQFLVDQSGSKIWARWPDWLSIENAATYLLGPVLGFVLRLRGTVCLHASVVAVDNRSIALMGRGGSGKSTLAAIFARMGFPVLADDVAALSIADGEVLVQPGYPRLRLHPEAVESLYGSRDALPRLTPDNPTFEKRYLDLSIGSGDFVAEPLPLAAIYTGAKVRAFDRTEIVPVPAHLSLLALAANSYMKSLLDPAMRAREFDLLSRVTRTARVRWINSPIERADPFASARLILEDFRTDSSIALPAAA